MIGSTIANIGLGLLSANRQAKQAKQTLAAQQQNFGKLETAAQPYLGLGADATKNLADPVNSFHASPGFDFAIKTGTQNVLGSTALNGLLRSGSAVKALDKFSTGLANQDYNSYIGQQQGNAAIGNSGLNALSGAVNGNSNAMNAAAADRNTATTSMFNGLSSGIGALAANPNINAMLSSILKKNPAAVSGGSSYTMNNAPASISL